MIRNTVCSQEPILAKNLLFFNGKPLGSFSCPKFNPNGTPFSLSNFQSRLSSQILASMEDYYDQSQLSCSLINRGPKWDPLSSPGLQQALTSHLPLREMLNASNGAWADPTTPQGSTLLPLRWYKGIFTECSSLHSRGIFHRCTPCMFSFRSLCVQVWICYNKCTMNVAILDS